MITADPRSKLGYYCKMISRMEVGERLTVNVSDLRDISSYEHNEAQFTPPDRILENIVGSAYTYSYWTHPDGQTVTFTRHEETGKRHYESPDRRRDVSIRALGGGDA